MKKVLLVLSVLLSSVVYGENLNLNYNDINYGYSNSAKKCKPVEVGAKVYFVKLLRDGYMIVDKKIETDAGGSYYSIVGAFDNKPNEEVTIEVFTNYGSCRLYEDIVLKNMTVTDKVSYKNLVYK